MNWKGAKAKLPCFCCMNVLGMETEDDLPDGCVTLNCPGKPLFVENTNEDWWGKADALVDQKGVLGKTKFEKLETACGLNLNVKGLLFDKELRPHFKPVDVLTYDAMHIMLVEGVGQAEICSMLTLLMSLGESWQDIHSMMNADWHVCRVNDRGRRAMRSTFSSKREATFKRNGTFNPDASELLAMFPIFGHYLETIAMAKHGDVLKAAIDSYRACACCIALAKEGKTDATLADKLTEAILKHAEQKHIAYPDESYRAKDHWRFHLGDQMARDGGILDCFAGERVNRAFKRCAQECSFNEESTFAFEATVLKRTMVHFEAQWEEYDWKDRLLHPVRAK